MGVFPTKTKCGKCGYRFVDGKRRWRNRTDAAWVETTARTVQGSHDPNLISLPGQTNTFLVTVPLPERMRRCSKNQRHWRHFRHSGTPAPPLGVEPFGGFESIPGKRVSACSLIALKHQETDCHRRHVRPIQSAVNLPHLPEQAPFDDEPIPFSHTMPAPLDSHDQLWECQPRLGRRT